MKIQKPQYEIWMQNPGELGIYQQIERQVEYATRVKTTPQKTQPSHSLAA